MANLVQLPAASSCWVLNWTRFTFHVCLLGQASHQQPANFGSTGTRFSTSGGVDVTPPVWYHTIIFVNMNANIKNIFKYVHVRTIRNGIKRKQIHYFKSQKMPCYSMPKNRETAKTGIFFAPLTLISHVR